ncbi:MAG TPA: hypothetical protein VKZ70_00145 [Burkholderiaceae bacterium]|nr:hypothetical protein [Burkholderiaceae bacterium]
MKQLVNHPVLLALILSLPLWIVLGNYLVAIIVALLVSFLLSMYNALRVLKRKKRGEQAGQPTEDTE